MRGEVSGVGLPRVFRARFYIAGPVIDCRRLQEPSLVRQAALNAGQAPPLTLMVYRAEIWAYPASSRLIHGLNVNGICCLMGPPDRSMGNQILRFVICAGSRLNGSRNTSFLSSYAGGEVDYQLCPAARPCIPHPSRTIYR